jgi:hypothetical protein
MCIAVSASQTASTDSQYAVKPAAAAAALQACTGTATLLGTFGMTCCAVRGAYTTSQTILAIPQAQQQAQQQRLPKMQQKMQLEQLSMLHQKQPGQLLMRQARPHILQRMQQPVQLAQQSMQLKLLLIQPSKLQLRQLRLQKQVLMLQGMQLLPLDMQQQMQQEQ